ncbi:MAG: LacI family DNA-binding transcriptional regulator [Spirochaetota bacterium]
MPTILDVALKAGVSKTTVSRFLNGQGPISEETAERIRATISRLQYSPNHFAQGMRTSRTKTIGIVIPDYANPFYPELIEGIEDYAQTHGYVTQLSSTHADPDSELERLKEMVRRHIDGIVFCSYGRAKRDIDYLVEIADQIPVVVMDPLVRKEPLSYVVTAGRAATREAVSYLVSIGRNKIGYIKGPSRRFATNDRFEGYKDGLAAQGIPYDKALVIEADFSLSSGYAAAEAFLRNGLPVDSVMTATDLMAIGAIKAFNQHHVTIPQRVAVVGFDDISLCRIVEPSLTTIAQPINALGTEAAKIIIDAINSGNLEKRQISMEGRLIVRKSSDPDYQDEFSAKTGSFGIY